MRDSGPSVRSDDELLDALRRHRSEAAFRELHRRHSPRLLLLLTRMVGGDQAQAEDLVQDTWIRGLEKLSTFRGEARFASWLTRIGIRMCQDHLRRDRKAPLSLVPSTDLVGGLPDYERRMDLENVLARMPERYRSVLLLHDVEGFTHGEIGELLGIAEGTSKSRLSAARRLGRELLTGKGGRAATESSRQESGST